METLAVGAPFRCARCPRTSDTDCPLYPWWLATENPQQLADLDANVDSNGFKICAHAPSSPHPPDQAPSPPPPAACIGDDRKCTSDYNDCYADGVYEMQYAGLVLKLQTN